MAGEWIVPFKGRNATGVYGQNLLWRSGHVFVMDNHRAATWCWLQSVCASGDHVLVHIDRHNDALGSQLNEWIGALPHGIPAAIQDYLAASYPLPGIGDQATLFRWDNYLSIYLALFGNSVSELILATHGEGDTPKHRNVVALTPDALLSTLESRIVDSRQPAILNVDLDYFFEPGPDDEATRMLDDTYFDALTAIIAGLNSAGHFPVITIALTATCDLTAGWGPPEHLAERLCAALGHDFALPAPTK